MLKVRISGRHFLNLRLGRIRDDYPEIKEKLFRLQNIYGLAQEYYHSCYPKFELTSDARLTVFAKCANVIASTNFGVHFMIENMLSEDWWMKTDPWANQIRKNHNYDRANDLREYNVFLRVGLLIQHFRAIESSFRDYVRAIWPEESSDGTGNFTKIYGILAKKLNLQLEYEELLNLYNETRNLMHNNGVYYPWNPKLNQQPESFPYKKTTYNFEPKNTAEFTNWQFVLMLVQDCVDMILAVVNHGEITKLPAIRDSFAKQVE